MKRGHSLIEVILAMTVLAVALPGVVTGMSAHAQQLVRGMHLQIALDIADLKLAGVVADNEGKGYEAIIARAYPSETYVRDGLTYRCSTEIAWITGPPLSRSKTDQGLKWVRVTVRGPSGVDVALQTIVSDHDEIEPAATTIEKRLVSPVELAP